MKWKILFILYLLAMAAAALAWYANVPHKNRYRQYPIVKGALTYASIALLIYSLYIDYIRKAIEKVLEWFSVSLDPPTLPVFYNLLLLLIFAIGKFIVTRKRKYREDDESIQPQFGYEFSRMDGTIVLKKEFFFSGDLFILLTWFALVLLIFCFYASFAELPIAVPFMPVLSFILLSECAWYLGGDRHSYTLLNADGKDFVKGAFSDMWEKYLTLWNDRVLAACKDIQPAKTENRETIAKIGKLLNDPDHRHNLLIEGSLLQQVFPDLAQCFWDTMVNGGKILVLLDTLEHKERAKHALLEVFSSASLHGTQWHIEDLETYTRQSSEPDILLATPRFLAEPRYRSEKWLADIRLVFIPDIASISHSFQQIDILLKSLKDIHPEMDYRIIMLSDARERAAVSCQVSLSIGNLERHVLENVRPPQRETIIWQAEAERWFQHDIFQRESDIFLGAEPILSTLAWMYQVTPVRQYGQSAVPWRQRTDELQNHVNSGFFDHLLKNGQILSGHATEILEFQHTRWIQTRSETACIIVRDTQNNLTTALHGARTHAATAVFVHVVSPPYLLRDYMAANIEYFESQPVMPFLPILSKTPHAIAIQLLKRMSHAMIDSTQLLRLLREYDETIIDVVDGLRELFSRYFGMEIVSNNLIKRGEIRYRYNKDKDVFEEYECYGLLPEVYNSENLSWLEHYELTSTCNGEEFTIGTICRDHLYQRYLPDQIHAFNGDAYLVRRIDCTTKKIELEHRNGSPDHIYCPDIAIQINAWTPSSNKANSKEISIINAKPRLEFCEADFTVTTSGFFRFERGVDLSDGATNYMECDDVPDRDYSHGRVLKLTFDVPKGIGNYQRIAFTISHLMNEMLRTFLPETYKYVHAGTLVMSKNDFFGHLNLSRYVPVFSISQSDRITIDSDSISLGEPRFKTLKNLLNDCASKITIFLAEDSHQDMGICNLLYDEMYLNRLFGFMYDYLKWISEDPVPCRREWHKNSETSINYLRYGESEIPKVFDIQGALLFFECLGFGNNKDTIYHRRTDYYAGERDFEDFSINPDTATTRIDSDETIIGSSWRGKDKHQCDYCGKQFQQREMVTIDGALERCPECSSIAVKEFDELLDLYCSARDFIEKDMGVILRQGITVQFAITRRIQEEAGIEFIPTSRMDPRAIGIAISDGRIIMIENGAPSHAILATLVHELTHIWQYDNLDYKRMHQDKGLLLIEGHTMWAELECLERKKLAPERCSKEKRRSDVYGQGYRVIVQMLKKNTKHRNPFAMLLDMYKK